jgi:YD repeat-containing protein
MSDSGLGDAIKSKKEQRAAQGADDAQSAATPLDWDDVGRVAEQRDADEKPRRKQTNIDLPEKLKRRFKAQVQAEGLQMRFVLEDLIRLYLDRSA